MEPTRFTTPPPPKVTPEPGVYTFGMDEAMRRALNFAPGLLSYSKLKRHDDPDKKISPYVAGVGNLVNDTLLFGGKAAAGKYFFWPEQYNKSTKEGKAQHKLVQAEAGDRTIIRPKERDEAARLIELALANPDIVDCLNAPGYCEAGMVADVHGLRFRSWVDKLLPKTIVDIKTSRAANEGEFLDTVSKYGYDGQAALYLDQAEQLGLGQLNYAWIVISKTNPRAFVVPMPAWAYWTGRRWCQSMIRSFHREQALRAIVQETTDAQ